MARDRNGRQTSQGMMALLSAIFPAPAPIPLRSRKTASIKARSPARSQAETLAAIGLKGVIFQGLDSVSLAALMGSLLVAYNLRDTISAQAAHWVLTMIG